MVGKLVIFSAPSGAGKTTIVRRLLAEGFPLEFSVSATSRKQRGNETDGYDYLFMSPGQFRERISCDEFVEWEEVYPDHLYGTLKSEMERIWANGNSVIFDVDVTGGLNLKKLYGEMALAIFLMPPSIRELERRLKARRSESEEKIAVRLAKAEEEILRSVEFDHVIVNDDLEKAIDEAVLLLHNFLEKKGPEKRSDKIIRSGQTIKRNGVK